MRGGDRLRETPHGWKQLLRPARRHRDAARRRRVDDQDRRHQDGGRARRRSGTERQAGLGRRGQPRAAGGMGRGQGLAAQQADPGAGGPADQRNSALGHRAVVDGGRRFSLLRRVRENPARLVPSRPSAGAPPGTQTNAAGSLRRYRRLRAREGQRRHPYRLHPVRGNRRHRAGHGGVRHFWAAGRRAGGCGGHHDGRCVRRRRGHREAG